MFAAAFLSAALLAAPLPKEQPRPLEARVVGEWVLIWGGTEFPCEIGKDGSWICRSGGGTTWVGSWRAEGDRWLFEESVLNEQTGELGTCCEYAVEFAPQSLEGRRVNEEGQDLGMSVALRRRAVPQ